MKHIPNRLADKTVKSKKTPGYYPDGLNLYLQVSASGSKSWIFRYTLAGKAREMGLGAYPVFSLADARERANSARKLLADGDCPLALKRETVLTKRLQSDSIVTFDDAADRYVTMRATGWTNAKHAQQWRNTIKTYASPIIGTMPVHKIDNTLVAKVLEPIWIDKRETAERVRQRIGSVLDWAKTMKYRTGDNPADFKGNLDILLPKIKKTVEHQHALPFSEIGAFMAKLATMPGMAALALQFLILTATRTGETLGGRWSEFDLTAGVWTIPAERMKAKREHTVPLSDAALAILQKAKAEMIDSEFAFANSRSGAAMSENSCLSVLKRMERTDVTTHGMRSTFRDWASEVAHCPNEVAEMALAHSIKDKTEAAYRRGDLFAKRAKLMADWAAYCALIPAENGANVVQLREVAA